MTMASALVSIHSLSPFLMKVKWKVTLLLRYSAFLSRNSQAWSIRHNSNNSRNNGSRRAATHPWTLLSAGHRHSACRSNARPRQRHRHGRLSVVRHPPACLPGCVCSDLHQCCTKSAAKIRFDEYGPC